MEEQEDGRLGCADRATQASPQAPTGLGHSVSVTDADEVADAAASSLKPETFEPFIRNAADEVYGRLLTTVQDYLIDNARWNIGVRIETAEREAQRLRQLNSDLLKALGDCRTNIAGYAISSNSQIPDLLSNFLTELKRIDNVARDALGQASGEPR